MQSKGYIDIMFSEAIPTSSDTRCFSDTGFDGDLRSLLTKRPASLAECIAKHRILEAPIFQLKRLRQEVQSAVAGLVKRLCGLRNTDAGTFFPVAACVCDGLFRTLRRDF